MGGLLEAKKIATLAEVHYAQIAPHLYNGPVGAAASIQLATCTPNFLIQESIMTWGGFHAEVVKTPIRWEDGYIIPSNEPGLGIGRHGRRAPPHAVHRRTLHLQMGEHPVDVKDLAPRRAERKGHMSYDYIIVGAPAGCILANRLSESGRHSVLLLEAGDRDASFWFRVPVGFTKTYYNRRYNWMYYSG